MITLDGNFASNVCILNSFHYSGSGRIVLFSRVIHRVTEMAKARCRGLKHLETKAKILVWWKSVTGNVFLNNMHV